MALADVVVESDIRSSLTAIRDRLAAEMDDVTWEKHKDACHCVCGMGDGRTLVALAKELRAVIVAIDSLPGGERRSKSDELADRRARRLAAAAGS